MSYCVNYYILTCLHIVDPCKELPTKKMYPNEYPKWGYGCSGAVYQDGEPSKLYCTDDDKYPWWKSCCQWNGSSCIPNGGKRNIKQKLSIRTRKYKMSLKWSDHTNLSKI